MLSIWHQDPQFVTPDGKPADLKIYGRGATFEALVKSYGRGIPTRAMLDELTRAGAAEVLSSGLVRAKTLVVVDRGLTPQAIRAFGDRTTELVSTLLRNMRNPESPDFIASVSGENMARTLLPLFRKELAAKGADFLTELNDSLCREVPDRRRKKHTLESNRVSVTIFYHEAARDVKHTKTTVKQRKNLRRNA